MFWPGRPAATCQYRKSAEQDRPSNPALQATAKTAPRLSAGAVRQPWTFLACSCLDPLPRRDERMRLMHTPGFPKRPRPSGTAEPVDRRTALGWISAAVAGAAWPAGVAAAADDRSRDLQPNSGTTRLRKIATEEAFTIPQIADAVRDVVRRGGANLDLKLLRLIYDRPPEVVPAVPSPLAGNRDALASTFLPRLLDLGAGRLADMDANGVDMHLLSLTGPESRCSIPPRRSRSPACRTTD